MLNARKIPILIACSLGISACTTSGRMMKHEPSAPPQMMKVKANRHPYNLEWRLEGDFYPIPKSLLKEGEVVCQAANFRRAIGYNSKARDVAGRPIPGGGFLCAD